MKYDLYSAQGMPYKANATAEQIRQITGIEYPEQYAKYHWMHPKFQIVHAGATFKTLLNGNERKKFNSNFTENMLAEWRRLNLRYGSRFREERRNGQI